MPLPPLPSNNTARFKIFYTNVGHQHVTQVRGTSSPASLGSQFDVLMTALSPILYATTIDKVEFAASGSNIFNIVTSGIEGNTYGSGAGSVAVKPYFYGFIGRSTGGYRVRFDIFGATILGLDYRFQPGEDVNIDAAVLVPQASASDWLAVDGVKPTWYSYVNGGVNAYYQRKNRP
jgi:hypothetical protein